MELLENTKIKISQDPNNPGESIVTMSTGFGMPEVAKFISEVTKSCEDREDAVRFFYMKLSPKERLKITVMCRQIPQLEKVDTRIKLAFLTIGLLFELTLNYCCLIEDEFTEATSVDYFGSFVSQEQFDKWHEEMHHLMTLLKKLDNGMTVSEDTITLNRN